MHSLQNIISFSAIRAAVTEPFTFTQRNTQATISQRENDFLNTNNNIVQIFLTLSKTVLHFRNRREQRRVISARCVIN